MKKFYSIIFTLTAFISCDDDDFTAVLQVGEAPTIIENVVTVAPDSSGLVTITPNAQGAYLYEILFNGTDNDTIVGINGVASHIYEETGEFSATIIATAPNNKTTEETVNFTVGLGGAVMPSFEVDFEDEMLVDSSDFGSPIQIIDNPVSDDINASSKVLEIQRGDGQFQGAAFSIPEIDLTVENKEVMIKLYSDIAVPLSVDLKAGLDGARSANVVANHTGSGWEELVFDFSMATKAFENDDPENFQALPADEVGVYTQLVFIIDGDLAAGSAGNIFYMDDIIKFD